MIERSKLIFNLTYGELIDGLREDLLHSVPSSNAAADVDPLDAGPKFQGIVCYNLHEAEVRFGVSHKTMCQWKKTWMAPAWQTVGRKVRLDYDYAILLMERRKKNEQ